MLTIGIILIIIGLFCFSDKSSSSTESNSKSVQKTNASNIKRDSQNKTGVKKTIKRTRYTKDGDIIEEEISEETYQVWDDDQNDDEFDDEFDDDFIDDIDDDEDY